MNLTYITAIPLQGRFDLELLQYQASWLKDVIPTRYPIIQAIHQTMKPEDRVRILAIRQENADTERNYQFLLDELATLGIPASAVQEISLPEEQSTYQLTLLLRRIVDAIPEVGKVFACITYGTKSIPIVIMSALSCAEKIRSELEIGGLFYGEVQREGGAVKLARFCDMSPLYQLSTLVTQMSSGDNAADMFSHLMWMNELRER